VRNFQTTITVSAIMLLSAGALFIFGCSDQPSAPQAGASSIGDQALNERNPDPRSREILNPRPHPITMEKAHVVVQEVLTQIYSMQAAYHDKWNCYCLDACVASAANPNAFEIIDISINSGDPYIYCMTASNMTFTCCATAVNLDDDATTDVWTVDQEGKITCTSDDIEI